MAEHLTVKLDILNMPELVATLRRQMADTLRDFGDGEPAIVRKKLDEAAALFEVGARRGDLNT